MTQLTPKKRPLTRENTLVLLRQFKNQYAKQYGILEIGVFGSMGRGEAREDSDVDICIKTLTPNPFALVHIKELIEARLHKSVDIVRVRDNMNPYLKERIEKEALYV